MGFHTLKWRKIQKIVFRSYSDFIHALVKTRILKKASIFTIIWNLLLKFFLGHFPNLLKYSDCCNVAYAMDKEIITKKNWLALFLNSRKLGVDFQNSDYFGLSGVTFIFESSIQNWESDFFGGDIIYSKR